MIPLSQFNQRLAKSVRGDGTPAAIIDASGSPSRPIRSAARPLSTHERLPQFHSWSSSATTDIYWLAVVRRKCGQVLRKKNWARKYPKDFEKGKRGTIKASDLQPKWSGHRKKANAAALIKEAGLDWRRVLPSCFLHDFHQMQENDPSLGPQLNAEWMWGGIPAQNICPLDFLLCFVFNK